MNVYHLYPRPDAPHVLHGPYTGGWDEVRGFVVIAENETQTRDLVGGCTLGRDWYDVLGGCGAECKRGACLDQADQGYMRRPGTAEGPCIWRDPAETDCLEIATGAHGKARIVLRDYCAG